MDFWQRARSFAEEASKRSQVATVEAAKRSQEFTISSSSKLAEIVLLASKRSKEIATEASKRAKEEVIKRADQITQIPAAALSSIVEGSLAPRVEEANATTDLEKFGVTDALRELAKCMNVNTFRDFPLEDDSEISDVPAVSNVQQDLTPWQERHAKLVLSNVEEISKLRYELCPGSMKERKFWRIYFILVSSHVAPFEKRFMEEAKIKPAEQGRETKLSRTSTAYTSFNTEVGIMSSEKSNTSSTADLDVFLLGDLGETDDELDKGDEDFDHDDFL